MGTQGLSGLSLPEGLYTYKACAQRVYELLVCEDWTEKNRRDPKYKPRHAWINGADKLFYENQTALDFNSWVNDPL